MFKSILDSFQWWNIVINILILTVGLNDFKYAFYNA